MSTNASATWTDANPTADYHAESQEAYVEQGLTSDIRLLDGLLGNAIRRLAGEPAFARVEEIRVAARALRDKPSLEEARKLRDRLDSFDLPMLRTLIRAFSVYFDLINLAEQQARVRSLRLKTLAHDPKPVTESIEAGLLVLRERGITAENLEKLLRRALVGPVFTAHPSEARRLTILEKLDTIAKQLDALEYTRMLPREKEQAVDVIGEEIETFWLSDTVRNRRPSVLDEVQQGIEVVETTLFTVVPRFYREFESALERVYPEIRWERLPAFLRFGSWIGGDRDGNPYVTHTATAQAVRLHQEVLLKQYIKSVENLGKQLSQSSQFMQPGQALQQSLANDGMQFPNLPGVKDTEPYRSKLRYIAAKLRNTLEYLKSQDAGWIAEERPVPSGIYMGPERLRSDLKVLADDLIANRAEDAADGPLRDLRRLVDVFGTHLLKLDIRQHSNRHAMALEEIFHWAGICPRYTKLTPNERFELLAKELEQVRPLLPMRLTFSPETCEVVQTFRTINAVLEEQAPEAIETYIISSTTEPAHLLEVLLLAREARLFRPQDGVSRLNIVPLFEALEPLANGGTIIQRLLTQPIYRKHLQLRGDLQEVMIGYSDSNKESGFLQSAWSLYLAQRAFGDMARRTGTTIQIFHGRGGSIGRGGGPANRAILAQPRGTVDGRIRITEQGEMIADRYGHPAIAARHLEQVLNAVLRSSFAIDDNPPAPTWERLLDRLSERACKHYRSLVYDNPEFLNYFEQATPIAEIASLKIGSRPSRRVATRGIDQLRAIPWVFSWMQSRHTLPGWYGLGSAVKEYLTNNPDDLATLRTMYQKWHFWRTLVDNAQMILAKADLTIARLYADLVDDQPLAARIFGKIQDEYQCTVDVICQITEQKELLDNVPVLKRSIQRRNPYVDPMSFIQLVMLKRLRTGGASDELLTGVLESINGIASGLKNTG